MKEDRFVFTNTFKKRREYKFEEIEERQLRACYRYCHNGKHIVCISMLLDDFYMLSEAIAAYRGKEKERRRNTVTTGKEISRECLKKGCPLFFFAITVQPFLIPKIEIYYPIVSSV